MFIRNQRQGGPLGVFDSVSRLGLFMAMSDGGDGGSGGSGDDDRIKELERQLEAERAKKNTSVDNEKALKAKLADYEAKEKEREAEEAKKRGEFDKLTAEQDGKIKEKDKKIENLVKKTAIDEAVSSAKIAPQFAAAVKAMIKAGDLGKLDVDIEADTVTIDGKSVTDTLKAYAETDAGKHFVVNGNGGGGAGGGGNQNGGTAWKDMTRTQKAQHLNKLKTENPAEYERLAATLR